MLFSKISFPKFFGLFCLCPLRILFTQRSVTQGECDVQAQEGKKIPEVMERVTLEYRFFSGNFIKHDDLVTHVHAVAVGRHPLVNHILGGMAYHAARQKVAVQADTAEESRKYSRFYIPVRKYQLLFFLFRVGDRLFTSGKFL